MFDSHLHLTAERFDEDVDEVVARARAAGVSRMVTIATNPADARAALDLTRRLAGVVGCTAGLHPHDASEWRADTADTLRALLAEPEVVAVGETGLDFHYDNSPRDVQRAVFREQIRLAQTHDLALVIHTREAWEDTFEVLDEVGTPERTVFHCFTGGPEEADECLDRGAYLSFSGIVTFKAAADVRAAAARTPLDRLLVETDSPYLAPTPNRGRTNQPAWVPLVGAGVAEAAGHSVEAVAAASWDNATACYRLD